MFLSKKKGKLSIFLKPVDIIPEAIIDIYMCIKFAKIKNTRKEYCYYGVSVFQILASIL